MVSPSFVSGLPFALVQEHRVLGALPLGNALGEASRKLRKAVLDELLSFELVLQSAKRRSKRVHGFQSGTWTPTV